ncbi:MAG: GerAB/ArcD/ProY family transporter [Oscillospiraceae bacterium]|nr:GerAB/ArcD/ProY family transporter [Oscillospiraceae bacterium]
MLQRKEMTALLINLISVKMLLTFPRIFIINAGNAAWIQAIYNTAVVFLIFFLTVKLYRGRKNVIELAGMRGGKGLKILVGMIVFVILLINFSSIVRIFPESVKSVLLQDFKIEVIVIAFVIAIAIGAYIGIQSIAKINYLFMPVAGAVFIAFMLLLIPYYRLCNIMPLMGQGYKAILGKGFNTLSLFSDIIFLNIFLPYYENAGEAKQSGIKALAISAIIAVIILSGYCLVYPYPSSKEFIIPVYQLARIIHLSSFFSRFEALFQFAWSILILLYSSVYVYAMCYVWQITFNLKFYKPLIFPIVLISSVVAMIPSSMLDLISTEEIKSMIVYPTAFLLPVIFGIVSRKYYGEQMRKGDKNEEI